jgi:predicted GNAT family N-acyltransferase
MSEDRGTVLVRLVPARWPRDRAAIEPVRRSVFIGEQGIAESDEWDDQDAVSRHVIAVTEKRDVVGTGRLEPTGKIGRVAVLSQYRGAGVGRAIMSHLVNQATELGFTQVYVHAQSTAVRFYERLGFRPEGPEFDEVGIPHRRMRRGIWQRDEHKAGRDGDSEHPIDAR